MSRPSFKDFKRKALSNPDVKKEYDALETVFELRKSLIELRTKSNVTQERLAELMHTKKSNISRLESGDHVSFPTLSTIDKYAHALGYKVKIDFEPI